MRNPWEIRCHRCGGKIAYRGIGIGMVIGIPMGALAVLAGYVVRGWIG